jgi:hypothetical protein
MHLPIPSIAKSGSVLVGVLLMTAIKVDWWSGTRFTNFTKFLINIIANFLLAPLLGILHLAYPLT